MKTSKESRKKPNRSSPRACRKGTTHRKANKASKVVCPPIGSGGPLARFKNLSPVSISKLGDDPTYYLSRLFPENRLKSLGTSLHRCMTGQLSEFARPLGKFSLVVPAYMSARWGLLKQSLDEGTNVRGPRTNANTEKVRFVVFQSKNLTLAEQFAAIGRLREKRPLVMVTHSGPGTDTLEAWFTTKALDEPQILKFRKYAAALGAPKSVFINAHPYALPGGTTENGFKIKVIYWNPSAI